MESGYQEVQDRMHLALLPVTVIKQYRNNQWGLPRSSSEELFNYKYNSTHIILSVLLGRNKSVCKFCGCSFDCNKSPIYCHKSGLPISSSEALKCQTDVQRGFFDSHQTVQHTKKTEHEDSAPSHPQWHSHTDPLHRGSTLHKESKIPGPRGRDQQALNEEALQKSAKSKFKLFEARGRLKTHLLHLAQGGNAHL